MNVFAISLITVTSSAFSQTFKTFNFVHSKNVSADWIGSSRPSSSNLLWADSFPPGVWTEGLSNCFGGGEVRASDCEMGTFVRGNQCHWLYVGMINQCPTVANEGFLRTVMWKRGSGWTSCPWDGCRKGAHCAACSLHASKLTALSELKGNYPLSRCEVNGWTVF